MTERDTPGIIESTWRLPLLGLLLMYLAACEPPTADDTPLENLLPQTHLAIGYFRADEEAVDTLSVTASRVGLSWWGEDADGWIDHYLYRWDYEAEGLWHQTTQESDTFIVLLEADTVVVRFEIVAVDNEGGVDQSPAGTVFPAYNTKPEIAWTANSLELLTYQPGTFEDSASWTFPYVTFQYSVWDLDGDETVTQVLWALDDTSAWNEQPLGLNSIVLGPEELGPGEHRFFMKASDIAQAWSETLTYPRVQDTLGTGEPILWMVRELHGDLLVVLDDDSRVEAPENLRAGFQGMGYAEDLDYTFWYAYDWVPDEPADLENLLAEFQAVFWISWKNTQMESVCESLNSFVEDGGKLLISTTDVGRISSYTGEPYLFDGNCVPLDSLTNQRHYIYPGGSRDHPVTPVEDFADLYPVMYTVERISFQGNNPLDPDFGFVPDSSAVELYYVPEDPDDPEEYPRVTVGARVEADGLPAKAKIVYLSLPVWLLDDLPAFFETLLLEEFDW